MKSTKIQSVDISKFVNISIVVQAVPRKGFGSADCVHRDRYIVYIVSQSADRPGVRYTDCSFFLKLQMK